VTVSVGHCHPDVVEVVRKQNETLQHSTTIYLQQNIARLRQEAGGENAGRIEVVISPTPVRKANDLALLMARRLHEQLRSDFPTQRVSRGSTLNDGNDRKPRLEI